MSRGERPRQERTSEERERDRIERERRRAERSGEPPSADPIEAPVADPEEHDPPEPAAGPLVQADPPLERHEHEPHEPPPASEVEVEPAAEPAPTAEPLPEHARPDPIAESPAAEAADDLPDPPAQDPLDAEEPFDEGPSLAGAEHDEAESGELAAGGPAARIEGDEASGFAIPGLASTSSVPARPGLPPAPAPLRSRRGTPMRRSFRRPQVTGAPGGPRRRRGGIASRVGAVVALLAVAAAIVLLIHSLTRSSHTAGTPAVAVIKVLIPEGKTRVQIAQIASAAGLKGSYREAARRSNLLNPTHYGAPHGTPDLEGFLFPATYELDRGAPAARLVAEQLSAFQENFPAEDATRARSLGVTPYQLLTVASLIEREAQVSGDRAKIAAVIYNRLRAGMPIGIDAAIYYAVEAEKGIATYTHELTESQLRINSPYNTRIHTGLPPTPISNPGSASIQAAAHPAHAAYLYYVAGADGCGEQVFSDTQAEFQSNVAAYEAAKSKNGGHPPTCKHH